MPSGMCAVQPVVDDGGDERPLARHLRLALDHRRDREDVVRREVLAPRVREVRPTCHFEPNSASWLPTRSADVDFRSKSYVSGKRKPSSGQLLGAEAGDHARLRGRRRVRVSRELHLLVRLAARRSSPPLSTRATICARVNPSGKTTRNCRSWRIVVVGCGSAARAAACGDRRDQHGADRPTSAPRTTRGRSKGDARRRARPRARCRASAARGRS